MNPVEQAIRHHLRPLAEASVDRLILEIRNKWNEATTLLNSSAPKEQKQKAREEQHRLHQRLMELRQHQQNMGYR
jgi:hypothetical protein